MSDEVEVRGQAQFVDVSEKTYRGGTRLHGVKVNGTKYSNFVKSDTPIQNAKAGDTVSLTAKQNDKGYWNFDVDSFKVEERGSSGGNQKQSYPQNDDNRQSSIVRQSSVGYASHIVASFAQSGYYETPDMAVADAVRLADSLIYPYAMEGKTVNEESTVGPAPDDEPQF